MKNIVIKYLDNSITEEESILLFDWLKESEANQKEFTEEYYFWHLSSLVTSDKDINIDTELDKLRRSIEQQDVDKIRKPRKPKRIFLFASMAASVSLLIISVVGYYKYQASKQSDITHYAYTNKPTQSNSTETQLILSDKKTLHVANNESSIDYYQDSIIAIDDNELIAKEESSLFNQLIIPYGKRSTIILSDGTKIWANAGTRLVYPIKFEGKQREIFVDGEIFLDVTPSTQPFIVKTPNIEVKVLGTRFNIKAYENDMTSNVVLVEGSVQILKATKNVTLVPNNMYEYHKDSQQETVQIVNTEKYTSWVYGKYSFDKEPASKVFNSLTRYYGISIKFDEEIAAYLCSGKLNLRDSLEEVLHGLSNSVPFSYTKEDDKYIIHTMKK